jgi:hypothetical protein
VKLDFNATKAASQNEDGFFSDFDFFRLDPAHLYD